MPEDNKPQNQKLKPGEKSLLLKVPESDYRSFRSRAIQLGVSNAEYLSKLLQLEAQHPIG